MKTLFLMSFMTLFTSCATERMIQKEVMLPNGHWSFMVADQGYCDNVERSMIEEQRKKEAETSPKKTIFEKSFSEIYESVKTSPMQNMDKRVCIEHFKKSLEGRSKELCGNDTFQLYGCLNTESATESGFSLNNNFNEPLLKCYLNCKPDLVGKK